MFALFHHWLKVSKRCLQKGRSRQAWDSLLVEHRTHDRKVASSNPSRSGKRIFLSRANFLCWLLSGVRSAPVLSRWHAKDPGHSAKSAGGRLYLNTHAPTTKQNQSGLTMPLSRHSVGTYKGISLHQYMQLIRNHSTTVVSAHWVTVDWLILA